MNILPHKSWHVRTKKNIARVRRDEEKAAKEEEERLRRINLAEHEARIQVLKAKRGLTDDNTKKTRKEADSSKDPPEKFSLFDNYQDTGGRDAEQEAEKKSEQEKWEVKTGIFSYIDGRYKHENEDQWYLKAPGDRSKEKKEEAKDKVLDLKEDKVKQRLDPLLEIKRNLAQMEKNSSEVTSSATTLPNQTTIRTVDIKPVIKTEPIDYQSRSHHSEEKKHKKKKKEKSSKHKKSHRKSKKRKHHSSDSDSESDDKKAEKEALAQKLRLERLERERKERLRTQLLLQGPSQPKTDAATLANQQRYNSQFNPHIARQNQPQ